MDLGAGRCCLPQFQVAEQGSESKYPHRGVGLRY